MAGSCEHCIWSGSIECEELHPGKFLEGTLRLCWSAHGVFFIWNIPTGVSVTINIFRHLLSNLFCPATNFCLNVTCEGRCKRTRKSTENPVHHTLLFIHFKYMYSFPSILRSLVTTRHPYTLRHCATSWKVAGSIPDGVIGTGVDWASNRNKYQGYFLWVKAAGA